MLRLTEIKLPLAHDAVALNNAILQKKNHEHFDRSFDQLL